MCCPIVPASESSDIRKRKTDYMRDQRSSQLLQRTLNLFATLSEKYYSLGMYVVSY